MKTHPDDYISVSVWTSTQKSTAILYPKSRLSSMGVDSMPSQEVFRAVEASSANDRSAFWRGEGGEHLARFSNAEQHQCHLLFVMWHDFQQLDSSNQKMCKDDYINTTYQCLSKARNATRVIRQLQSFAHFVCDRGETYIQPSKMIECNGDVIFHRSLFKRMVQKVLKDVQQSREAHQAAEQRTRSTPASRRVLNNTSTSSKQRVPQVRVISSALCEKYADEVVREYPLVSGIVSADLEDGLPIYTVKIAGEASSADQDNRYSHEALVVREENLVILATFNKKWKKEVVRVGEQIDPITGQRSPTITWKGKPQSVEVSAHFFDVVGWMDYYKLIRLSPLDDDDDNEGKSAPFTPARSATPHSRYSSSPQSLSSNLSTPSTPGEETIQKLHELFDRIVSKGISEDCVLSLCAQLEEVARKQSSVPAVETDKDTGSEMEEDDVKSGGSSVEDDERDEMAQDDDENDDDSETGRMDDDIELPDNEPRKPRDAKRKAITKLSAGTKKRAQARRA